MRATASVLLFTLLVTLHTPVGLAETIYFKDGKKITGKVLNTSDDIVTIDARGKTLRYWKGGIDRIEQDQPAMVPTPSIVSPQAVAPMQIAASTPAAMTPAEIFKRVSPAVVVITTHTFDGQSGLASGFIVEPRGVIVTNCHVLAQAEQAEVRLNDGRTFPIRDVLDWDIPKDLLVFSIEGDGLPTVPLADPKQVEIGQPVFVIGNPLGLEYSISDGLLAGVRYERNAKWLQFSAPISQGNSGGPVLNTQGQVLGVVSFMLTQGQNVNFAIASDEVRSHLADSQRMGFAQFAQTEARPAYYLSEGFVALAQKDFERARINAERALAIRQDMWLAYDILGYVVLNGNGDPVKALPLYQKALAVNPDDAWAYNDLGTIYHKTHQAERAIAAYQKAVQLDPGNARSRTNLGVLYGDLGRAEEAETTLLQVIQMDPQYVPAYSNLATQYWDQAFAKVAGMTQNQRTEVLLKALHLAQKIAVLDPSNPVPTYFYGMGYGMSCDTLPQAPAALARLRELHAQPVMISNLEQTIATSEKDCAHESSTGQ